MSKPIAIIFGAGENIGAAASTAFTSKGYRVVLVARTTNTTSTEDEMSILADLSKRDTVSNVFAKVRQSWGEPSLVLYNAAAVHWVDPTNPFTLSEEDFAADLAVNTTSAYVAMKEAIVSFKALPNGQPKTFFYTGNPLASPGIIFPRAFNMGAGKSATAHLIHVGSEAYKQADFE
jgi:NAD(P)-dependent dehydrogenase (short-subunit alcohol dehydrogenase family)